MCSSECEHVDAELEEDVADVHGHPVLPNEALMQGVEVHHTHLDLFARRLEAQPAVAAVRPHDRGPTASAGKMAIADSDVVTTAKTGVAKLVAIESLGEAHPERHLVMLDEACDAAARADAGRSIPHHLPVPEDLLRVLVGQKVLRGDALEALQRRVHLHDVVNGGGALCGVSVVCQDSISGDWPIPPASGALGGADGIESHLLHGVQDIENDGALRDATAAVCCHLVKLAVPQVHRLSRGPKPEP
mmetsp:Transcript_47927/g.104258  ORF Transcript_47927/g.104258 Transcript_47927/m.104258 type:complete len:246 (-) Transcript_47927:480-1217(-)